MPAYVIGARRTEKGHQNLKEFSAVLERFSRVREANGGTLIKCYATFGRFDMIIIAEYPSGTAMQRAMTTMLGEGVFTIEVSEAMPMSEFLAILKEEEQEH
ncbi:MAG TPA: GYD domain-containing protein [Candidatus Binataceae bacterium]|nr:GYD domain-containing protein [Candidatus Binataceae bacterium]HVC43198.1 GYD domain-containing protein [Candidatus Binataceae bacterium]